MIFYMPNISYINPYFRAPSLLKSLKSSPRYQNLPGEPLTAHSDQKTAQIDQETAKNRIMLIFLLYKHALGPLKASFDQLDR